MASQRSFPAVGEFPGVSRSRDISDIVLYWECGSQDSNVEGSI